MSCRILRHFLAATSKPLPVWLNLLLLWACVCTHSEVQGLTVIALVPIYHVYCRLSRSLLLRATPVHPLLYLLHLSSCFLYGPKKKRNAKRKYLYNSAAQPTNAWMQVADMAERSPDRQARVAAIEFLHAVLLWMVGERSCSLCEPGGAETDLLRSCAQG